jgi:outer membrane lipoprotein-sorting protein
MPVNKAWSRREYLGEHEIAQNLTLSSKTHSCKIESYWHRGDRTMDQGRKDSSFYRTVARFVRSLMGLLIIAAWPGLALAQGGETEVTKTTPSNPPPVVSAPAPVPPAPAAPAHVASKAASPVGGSVSSGWRAKTAQPPQSPPQPQTPAPVPALVQESNQEIIGKVNDYFNKLTNLEGTFVQTDPDNSQKQGRFYFARPGRLRFDYSLPSRLKIISNGYYLAIEDYALNTSDKYPLEMTPFRLLLSETVDLAKEANILGIEQGPDVIVVTVEDKKGDAAGRISLFFDKENMSLKQWIITDAQGLDTRIQVSDLEQNKRVSAELFEFSKDVGFHRE